MRSGQQRTGTWTLWDEGAIDRDMAPVRTSSRMPQRVIRGSRCGPDRILLGRGSLVGHV
jgi:hypothetical protein